MSKGGNRHLKYIWIWLDLETGDCITTRSIEEMCKIVKCQYCTGLCSLQNNKKFSSKYKFWARGTVYEPDDDDDDF